MGWNAWLHASCLCLPHVGGKEDLLCQAPCQPEKALAFSPSYAIIIFGFQEEEFSAAARNAVYTLPFTPAPAFAPLVFSFYSAPPFLIFYVPSVLSYLSSAFRLDLTNCT